MNGAINESINVEHTLYTIYLRLDHDKSIEIGKLGEYFFQKGTYVYVGSAKRNIVKRIQRHKDIEKRLHWHFDYLRPFGIITKIITYDERLGECALAEKIRKIEHGTLPFKGFGSSDCKCYSHLIYLKE